MLLISDLCYRYPDGTEALRGINLSIHSGEKVALVGPNGAGKSTLLLHLNGVLRATSGSVSVGETLLDDSSIKQIRAHIGMVFQDPDDQLFSPTVFDDVAFGPLHMGLNEPEITERVTKALAQVGMAGFEKRMPHHLSVGQRKRIAIATVLSMNPDLLAPCQTRADQPAARTAPGHARFYARSPNGA
jgi:cobalt/nickel transport system ATP-binding protein